MKKRFSYFVRDKDGVKKEIKVESEGHPKSFRCPKCKSYCVGTAKSFEWVCPNCRASYTTK